MLGMSPSFLPIDLLGWISNLGLYKVTISFLLSNLVFVLSVLKTQSYSAPG